MISRETASLGAGNHSVCSSCRMDDGDDDMRDKLERETSGYDIQYMLVTALRFLLCEWVY